MTNSSKGSVELKLQLLYLYCYHTVFWMWLYCHIVEKAHLIQAVS